MRGRGWLIPHMGFTISAILASAPQLRLVPTISISTTMADRSQSLPARRCQELLNDDADQFSDTSSLLDTPMSDDITPPRSRHQ